MEEKIIIKSKQYNVKKLFVAILILGVILSAILYLAGASEYAEWYDEYYEEYLIHTDNGTEECTRGRYPTYNEKCSSCELVEKYSKIAYIIKNTYIFDKESHYCYIPFSAALVIGIIIYLWLHSYELTVTDKRVYGKTAWGKRVDLPVDSISAISSVSLLRGVTVATSSGKIGFLMIKNAGEIYSSLNELIISRQQEKANNAPVQGSTADELKKYKDLLDSGIISQEEFDAKKKQLLGV